MNLEIFWTLTLFLAVILLGCVAIIAVRIWEEERKLPVPPHPSRGDLPVPGTRGVVQPRSFWGKWRDEPIVKTLLGL